MKIQFEQKMREAVVEIKKYGVEYAEAKAQSWHLQEMRKVILAAETSRTRDGTFGDRDSVARASDAYRLHLEGTKEAIKRELTSKAMLETAKAKYEALRSLCSLEKKAMEIFEHE